MKAAKMRTKLLHIYAEIAYAKKTAVNAAREKFVKFAITWWFFIKLFVDYN